MALNPLVSYRQYGHTFNLALIYYGKNAPVVLPPHSRHYQLRAISGCHNLRAIHGQLRRSALDTKFR